MEALSFESAGAAKGAIAPPVKWLLIRGTRPVPIWELILSWLIALSLGEPPPRPAKIRLPHRDKNKVFERVQLPGNQTTDKVGKIFLLSLASINIGSKDSPNNLDPLNGADTSLHFCLESACHSLSQSRHLAVTADAMA